MRAPVRIAFAIATGAIAAGALLFAGCNDHPTGPGTIAGSYQYTAYNDADSVVVVGTISLDNRDSTLITGRWVLAAVSGAANVGPQTGTGTLTGSAAPGEPGVSINLNPGWADNTVFLAGVFSGREITGTWSWSTFAGTTASGRFVMSKR